MLRAAALSGPFLIWSLRIVFLCLLCSFKKKPAIRVAGFHSLSVFQPQPGPAPYTRIRSAKDAPRRSIPDRSRARSRRAAKAALTLLSCLQLRACIAPDKNTALGGLSTGFFAESILPAGSKKEHQSGVIYIREQ
jgi:hypothetical protein